MQRNPDQISLDRLLARAAVAKIPLEKLLNDKERQELIKIQKQITPETKKDKIAGLDAIVKKLVEGLNTPEVAATIKANFMKEGALAQKEALKIIYTQDPKLVIPVITKVIEDLLDKVKKRSPPSAGTLAFVEAALKKIKEVDEKQNGNIFELGLLLFDLRKEKIRADMMPLIEKVNGIAFIETEALAWFEAMLWIEGHFLREHEKALKIGETSEKAISYGNGKLVFTEDPEIVDVIDDDDKKVKMTAGTTKHFINTHFHMMAVLIERKAKLELKLGFKTVDVFPTKIVEESAIKETVTISEAEKKEERKSGYATGAAPIILIPSAAFTYDTKKTSDGKWQQLTTYIPAECPPQRIADAMKCFYKVIKGESIAEPEVTHESLLSRLKYSKSRNVADKNLFGFMMSALQECMLTGREDAIIHNHMPEFEVLVDQNYNKATRSGYKFRLYGDRAHASDVSKMFEYFKATDEMGRRKTTLEIITYLQATWQKANTEGSTLLYAVLEELIREMRDKLLLHLDSELQPITSKSVSAPDLKRSKHE